MLVAIMVFNKNLRKLLSAGSKMVILGYVCSPLRSVTIGTHTNLTAYLLVFITVIAISLQVMSRYEATIRMYGQEGFERIQNAKILVVGAGGIGCEVSYDQPP